MYRKGFSVAAVGRKWPVSVPGKVGETMTSSELKTSEKELLENGIRKHS